MSATTAACVRGCAMRRRHLASCPLPEVCAGCLPRRADHGLLCWPCHRRLELMLHDAPIVYRWLTGNLATGQGATREGEHVTASRELPLPIKAAVYDERELLVARLRAMVLELCATRHVRGPRTPSVAADARLLTVWLGTVETMPQIVLWWGMLADSMIAAHKLAPWRPLARRVGSIPCPECGEVNLMIFGGETDITCGSCRMIIPEVQFGLWERIVKQEYGITVTS